jgi:hypothetical protein
MIPQSRENVEKKFGSPRIPKTEAVFCYRCDLFCIRFKARPDPVFVVGHREIEHDGIAVWCDKVSGDPARDKNGVCLF